MRQINLKSILAKILAASLVLILSVGSANAVIIADSEIEHNLSYILTPIVKAAHLDPKHLKFYIILDDDVNAFVINNDSVFINTGLLKLFNDPDVIKGVVAHELGHITSKHVMRRQIAVEEITKGAMIMSTLLGVGTILAGGGAGGVMAGAHIGQRLYMNHSRAHEGSADASAVQYLHASSNTVRGLMHLQESLLQDQASIAQHLNAYDLTHPLSQERLVPLKTALKDEEGKHYGSSQIEKNMYAMVLAKIRGFTEDPKTILSGNIMKLDPVARDYEVAIATFRQGNLNGSIQKIDKLIKESPKDPYLYELKAQFLYEFSKIRESVKYYKMAHDMVPYDKLIKVGYAIALANSLDSDHNNNDYTLALKLLNSVVEEDFKDPMVYRNLAIIYGKIGNLGYSNLMLAEEALLLGDVDDASSFARLALREAKNDNRLKLKIEDLLKSLTQLKKETKNAE